jgi:hypothetical protein
MRVFPLIWLMLGAVAGVCVSAPLPVTVVLNFGHERYSEEAVRVMKAETQGLLRDSEIDVHWVSAADLQGGGTAEGAGVIFRVKGTCAADVAPTVREEPRMALATTDFIDGEMLSFGELDCDRVLSAVWRVLPSGDDAERDAVLGRALGRVVAHEMYHMLAKSKTHDHVGVAREALTDSELTRERFVLSDASLRAIRRQIGLMKAQSGSVRSDEATPVVSPLP